MQRQEVSCAVRHTYIYIYIYIYIYVSIYIYIYVVSRLRVTSQHAVTNQKTRVSILILKLFSPTNAHFIEHIKCCPNNAKLLTMYFTDNSAKV
jgi:hypothetical protein